MEATTKSKADTLLRYVGCEGEKRHLLEGAAVAAGVCRGGQAQLGQKLRRTEEMPKGLRSGEGMGPFQDIYEGPGDDDWGMGARPGGVAPNGLSTKGGQSDQAGRQGTAGDIPDPQIHVSKRTFSFFLYGA